ncbi:hypothetical protein AYO37_00775 [Opitutia bacterium SCGC AG-212-L18]|nr:hypothetical protein AYO37_00775 [Opitutae bacterium SCGC AG-212-L18]
MDRIYEHVIEEHFLNHDQMIFLSGPRQSGKTTLSQEIAELTSFFRYYNWDNIKDRERILEGPNEIISEFDTRGVSKPKPILALDEIHKYNNWKIFLKGIYDLKKKEISILVTGSARLNIYKQGQDSLMGRYFLYRIHPLSVAELLRQSPITSDLSPPKKITKKDLKALLDFGGFPEPFLKQNKQFFNRWQKLRHQQFFNEDLRDLSQIHQIKLIEVLAFMIKHQTGQILNYSNLSRKVRVSDVTIRQWISVLEELYYCFTIRPWSNNVTRSLIKEPKVYLWDWSKIEDPGSKIENFVACHLLKAVHFWTDIGLGNYDLYYLRDKDQQEADFLIVKDNKPWILLEVKNSGNKPLSQSLLYFQKQIRAKYVLQLALDLDYIDFDFRDLKQPKIFPLSTFLSQLI